MYLSPALFSLFSHPSTLRKTNTARMAFCSRTEWLLLTSVGFSSPKNAESHSWQGVKLSNTLLYLLFTLPSSVSSCLISSSPSTSRLCFLQHHRWSTAADGGSLQDWPSLTNQLQMPGTSVESWALWLVVTGTAGLMPAYMHPVTPSHEKKKQDLGKLISIIQHLLLKLASDVAPWLASVGSPQCDGQLTGLVLCACRLQTHSAFSAAELDLKPMAIFLFVFIYLFIFFRWPPAETKLFCLTRALWLTFTRPPGHSLSS